LRCNRPLGFVQGMVLSLLLLPVALCQESGTGQSGSTAHRGKKFMENVFEYLNMAGDARQSPAFQSLTQKERNQLFGKSLINPVWYLKGAISAGQNQWSHTPEAWEQGASGYGKRYADIMGQYAVRKTVTFGLESLMHEDNRYFPSGKSGIWQRTGYALASGILARHDSGRRYPSVSLLAGYASGAYLSRFWQPPGIRSVGDAAVSFGVSMAWNIGFGVVKEFLPDMLRPLTKGKQPRVDTPAGTGGGE
jgi:hypothetical protein